MDGSSAMNISATTSRPAARLRTILDFFMVITPGLYLALASYPVLSMLENLMRMNVLISAL